MIRLFVSSCCCILHVCGGDPFIVVHNHPSGSVFSTYVEVIPRSTTARVNSTGILHVCGGDPLLVSLVIFCDKYSPRMWRWSLRLKTGLKVSMVFSTYVEVILFAIANCWSGSCILHVCGGDPSSNHTRNSCCEYSPRMWRWSRCLHFQKRSFNVFSTYVEVILIIYFCWSFEECILHVCGGDPKVDLDATNQNVYSPRMWRWSFNGLILKWLK